MISRFASALAICVVLPVVGAASCHLVGGTDGLVIDDNFGLQGNGGNAATGGTAGGQVGPGGRGGRGGAPGGMGGQGGGGVVCNTDTCPPDATECSQNGCVAGACEQVVTLRGTDCGTGWKCDGAGNCVACLETSHCTGQDTCKDDICVGPDCSNGTKDGAETHDDCGGPDCSPCQDTEPCVLDRDCESRLCLGEECSPCRGQDDCPGPNYCTGGDCKPKKSNGGGCLSGDWCLSGCCSGILVCANPVWCG